MSAPSRDVLDAADDSDEQRRGQGDEDAALTMPWNSQNLSARR
jgi:hypothetical protein